jgi:cyclic beta-1,2-glucan synthetase
VVPYFQLMLAESPADSLGRIETRSDGGVLLFANPRNDFRKGWAFAACSLDAPLQETVRARFFGGSRDPAHPHFVVYGGADATQADDGRRCAAFCGEVTIAAGREASVCVVLGQAADPEQALTLAQRYRDVATVAQALAATRQWWQQRLSVLRIETDRPEFDRLVNDWLPYQLLTARLWGRTGPQQRSGAFGFRDQLQDVLPLLFTEPQRARSQILLHAAQQFREGDVVKWWHPTWEGRTGIAVRTAASDPQLWLPYVVARYARSTGDEGLLDEAVPFIEGRKLRRGQEGILFVPRVSRDSGSVYEHCRRAIERALRRSGRHGLPLLGSGDWNDGLDLLGLGGRGESVWLGFFLHAVLLDFVPLAQRCEGAAAAARYRDAAQRLRAALAPTWRDDAQGRGYLRATDDGGAELRYAGSLMSAWPALSGAVDAARARAALEAGLEHLEKDDRVLLLTPPFDEHSRPYPGRIAEYPPGVRENGGQYSHGASWLVDAWLRCAEAADRDKDAAQAAHCLQRAWALWFKISPLSKGCTPDAAARYGLPPHQQPADVYDGGGHEGRGGWAWYTGAAARMLSTAYDLLGLRMENASLHCDARHGLPLTLKQVRWNGRLIEPGTRTGQ